MHANFDFCRPRCVSDALGLGSIADDDEGLDPEVLRNLYRYARSEDAKNDLFVNDPKMVRGWINLDAAKAQQIISLFVALDESDDFKKARNTARANLEAAAWNDILRIDDPPIRCRILIHGSKWGLRFQEAKSRMRGKERINAELPPIPGDDDEQQPVGSVTENMQDLPVPDPHPAQSFGHTNQLEQAKEALATGGLL